MCFLRPEVKNGGSVFFTQESFEKYSVQPTFIQQLVAKESALALQKQHIEQQESTRAVEPSTARYTCCFLCISGFLAEFEKVPAS